MWLVQRCAVPHFLGERLSLILGAPVIAYTSLRGQCSGLAAKKRSVRRIIRLPSHRCQTSALPMRDEFTSRRKSLEERPQETRRGIQSARQAGYKKSTDMADPERRCGATRSAAGSVLSPR
jgi:hypothetical protein